MTRWERCWRTPALIAICVASLIFPLGAAALETPKPQTMPFLDEEFRALDEAAFEAASSLGLEETWAEMGESSEGDAEAKRGDNVAALERTLEQLVEGVAAKYGADSREMLDMRRREAQLHALASNEEAALRAARKAVTLARRAAPAYALLQPNDPTLRLHDQIVAYQDFITIAAGHPDAASLDLMEEAFRVAQFSELTKPALVANRRLLERSLPEGDLRDLAQIAAAFTDQEGPLTEAVTIATRLGTALREAGAMTDDDVEVLRQQIRLRNETLALLDANADKLDGVLFPKPVTIAEIRRLLEPDEAYVAFVSGQASSLTVFCVTRETFTFLPIESGDWMQRVEDFRGQMGVEDARGATALGRHLSSSGAAQTRVLDLAWQLYSELFTDIAPLLADKSHLLLTLHGDLMKFPFEALVTRAPDASTTFGNAPWLVRSHGITVLPTVATLRDRQTAVPATAPRFLGIGNPDYDAQSDWEFSSREMRQIAQLSELPESADEVRGIGRYFNAADADMLLGSAANERQLEELSQSGRLAEYDILLFATHGLQPQEMNTVFEASLALTPTRDAPSTLSIFEPYALKMTTDGLLKSREIAKLKLDADLIILSACNSAADTVVEIDGYSGLASAFLKAGARTVMVSHWPVISEAAVEITTRTIGNLDGRPSGKPLALALRKALVELIESGGERAHPRYWAPFSLFGEP